MVVCVAIVAVSAFLDPLTGKCGTGPWLMFQMFGALVADGHAAPILVNVGFYSVTIALLYLKGADFVPAARLSASTSRTWFVPVLLTWTAFYLASYFFLFPTTSCP